MGLRKGVWVLFALAVTILVAIGVASDLNTRELVQASQMVSHTLEVISNINEVFGDLRDAESARRGYAITKLPVHRELFERANREVSADMRSLRELTQDNRRQQARLDQIDPLLSQRRELMTRAIRLQDQGALDPQTNVQLTAEGVQISEQIRALIAEMGSEENRLLAERQQLSHTRARNTLWIQGVGSGLAIALLAFAFVMLSREIGRRGAVEASLREQSETLRRQARLLDLTHDAIFLRNLDDDTIAFWNRGAQANYGWSPEEAVGRRTHDLLKTIFPRPLEQIRSELMEKGNWEGELLHSRRDGSRLIVSSRWSLYRDERGRPAGILEINNDITERKHAEQQLRDSEERFRLMIDAVKDYSIIFLDPSGNIRSWNAGAQRIKQFTAEEIIGKHYSIIFADEDALAGKPQELLQLASKYGRHEEEGLRRRKDGSVFWADAVVTALRDESGMLRGFSKVTRDITERKKAEEEREKATEDLRRSNTELQQFAYVASHDLQEPLRMVASYTQLLAKRYRGRLDRDADEFIDFAVDGARRMQDLIQDLLAYSRVGSRGKVFQPTNTNRIFERATENLGAQISEQHATVTSGPLPEVMGDDTQLAQLFQNLISNAIKFHGNEPPRVHLAARRQDSNWLFSVADNGIGIDPAYTDRIFVIFQRLHTREEYAGTGIGLAICRKIVERHGGRIWVESERGKGSTFFFTIPARV